MLNKKFSSEYKVEDIDSNLNVNFSSFKQKNSDFDCIFHDLYYLRAA